MPDGSVKHLHVVAHVLRDELGSDEFTGAVMDVTAAKQAEEEDPAKREGASNRAGGTRARHTGGDRGRNDRLDCARSQPAVGGDGHKRQRLPALAGRPAAGYGEGPPSPWPDRQRGHRAGEVMGRIRELVKKTPPRRDWLDINETILELLLLTDTDVRMNRISLQTQLASGLSLVRGDRIQMQQVILNLIKNAIEAMSGASEGPREMQVSSGKDASTGVVVAVRDSGPGLAPEALAHLFEPFYSTKPEGMGMGLAISRSIIVAHGGQLRATPNQPHGTVFEFTLPSDGDRMP